MASKKKKARRKIRRRKRHFFEATLVNPTTNVAYKGVGRLRKAARTRARALAIAKGEVIEDLEVLEVKSLVGPPPQTFEGNDDLPDPE